MRVVVATWTAQLIGGIEAYVSLLLPAMTRAGLEVAFWSEDEVARRLPTIVPSGVPVFAAAPPDTDGAIERLREWKPDVLYSQGLHDTTIERSLLRIAPAVRFVHTYTGTCISGTKTFTRPRMIPCDRVFGAGCLACYFPRGCGGRNPTTMFQLYREQSRRLELLRECHKVLTHSPHMQHELARHGVASAVVPFPVAAPGAERALRERPGVRLLFAGRMEALKGGMFLLDALPQIVLASGRPVHLTLAGDGVERSSWETRARALTAETQGLVIDFTGWVPAERIRALLVETDLLVLPSVWPEPFGSIGPEAAGHGVPAAAFDVGGVSQWLRDGVTGHLASADPPSVDGLARAVIRCLEDPVHYESLSLGARAMSDNFTMERHLAELLPVLDRAERRSVN